MGKCDRTKRGLSPETRGLFLQIPCGTPLPLEIRFLLWRDGPSQGKFYDLLQGKVRKSFLSAVSQLPPAGSIQLPW